MPGIDVSIGLQLAAARPTWEQSYFAPNIPPYQTPYTGFPIIDENHPFHGSLTGPNPTDGLEGKHEAGDLLYQYTFRNAIDAAALLNGKHIEHDYEPMFNSSTTAGTIAVAGGAVTFTVANDHTNLYGAGATIKFGGVWYDIIARGSSTTATVDNAAVDAAAGTAYEMRSIAFRETDPSRANLSIIAETHAEYARLLAVYARRCWERGVKISVYAELLTHQFGRIQQIIGSAAENANGWRSWLADVKATAALKVHNGQSIIDVVNACGGALEYPAYVPDGLWTGAHNKQRFRTYVNRINHALRSCGAERVRPIFIPNTVASGWVSDGLYDRVPAGWTASLIEDAVAIAGPTEPGYAIWGRQRLGGTVNECDATFIAELPA